MPFSILTNSRKEQDYVKTKDLVLYCDRFPPGRGYVLCLPYRSNLIRQPFICIRRESAGISVT